MSYLLDTDIVSNLYKKRPSSSLVHRLRVVKRQYHWTSAITIGELVYGAFVSGRQDQIMENVVTPVLLSVQVLPFDSAAAEIYGRIRADLQMLGSSLAEPDLRIAAIALSRGLTLVTGNVRHFERIEGLAIENWLE